MFTDAYKYREVKNGIFYDVEGKVIVRIFLSFLFKMKAEMLHPQMTFHGFCTGLALKVLYVSFPETGISGLMCNQEHVFAFWGRFPNLKCPIPPLTPQTTLDACIPEFFSSYRVGEDALFYEGLFMNALLSNLVPRQSQGKALGTMLITVPRGGRKNSVKLRKSTFSVLILLLFSRWCHVSW